MPDKPSEKAVAKCQEWRQGDFALECGGYLFGDVPEREEAAPEDEDELDLEAGIDGEPIQAAFDQADPVGFVVVSQTCDIVRDDGLVAVCPLERVVRPAIIKEVRAGRRPGFGLVENAPDDLVADFDRVMCISKELLATWKREPGFTDPAAAIRFARALERKLGRFAFPDDFSDAMKPFVDSAISKFHKDGKLGKALRSLAEFRVRSAPDWEAEAVTVQFFLIQREEKEWQCTTKEMATEFGEAFDKIDWRGAFSGADPLYRLGAYDDFSARDYAESVPLDLNALSFSAKYAEQHMTGED